MTTAHRRFWDGLCAMLPTMPALSVSSWAEAYRVMSKERTPMPGPFSCSSFPMQREPMDDARNPDVSEIVLQWSSQTAGKSEVLNNICGYYMHADPSGILYVLPTVELAESTSKESLAPMIRDSPALCKLVRDPRSRDSGNTVSVKLFPGGSLVLVGANAPSGLAARPRRVVLQDEIDRFPASAGTEGDPCALADKRAEAFGRMAVKVKTSTPTVRGRSRIEGIVQQSDCRKWHCACPRCGHEQVWLWRQVKWEEDAPETAWLECDKCGAHLTDDERVAAVRAGNWKPTQPFHGIRGYWLNGINTLWPAHKGYRNRLHQMASEFLKAKHEGAHAMRVWVNTFLAETYEEEAEAIAPTAIEERAEDYGPDTLPEECLALVAAADVQKDRIECVVTAIGRDDETWAVQKKVFDGDPEFDEVWSALDGFILSTFARCDGVPLKIERCFIDMGYKNRRVLEFCAPRLGRGVFACRGLNRVGVALPPILPSKPSRNNRARIPHWNIGVTVAKATLFDRLALPLNDDSPTPRGMHFPRGYGFDADHYKQLTSEKRRTRYSYGQPYSVFEKDNNSVRNEALDIAVYTLAAIESLGPINWSKLAENRIAQRPKPEPTPEAPKPSAMTTPMIRAPRRNFATSW